MSPHETIRTDGLTRPTAGRACVCGFDSVRQWDDVLRHLGLLIETPVFYDHLSARDSLALHLAYRGTAGAILQTAFFMALCMSMLSAAIGLLSTCMGFVKRSLAAAVVAAVILSSVSSNIFALAVSAACYFSLGQAVDRMEVL